MRSTRRMMLTVAVALALLPAAVATADQAATSAKPLALVAQIEGSATLISGGQSHPLELFARLGAGDRVETGADGTVVVAFLTGQRIRIDPASKAELTGDGVGKVTGKTETLPAVATVPALGALAPGQAPGPRSGAIRVRSGSLWGAEVEDLYPRDGAAAVADATVLTFHNLVNSESCKVDVENEMGDTVFSVETRASEVVIPAGVLVPDKEYYWRVRTAGRRSVAGRGEALFITLRAEDAAARETFRASAEKDGSTSALLLMAEVDRNLGLYRQACATLGRVEALEPGNPHLAASRTKFACAEYGPKK